MPSITIHEINGILSKYGKNTSFDTFVETGTFRGETIFEMSRYFKELHTIELSDELYNAAKNNANSMGITNIQFHHGDSAVVLPDLVPRLESKGTIFWLDGHFCHCGSAQGPKDCPLLEEVEAICTSLKGECIIIIDDVRLFEITEPHDWADITEENVVRIVKNSGRYISHYFIPSCLHPQDRMVIFLT